MSAGRLRVLVVLVVAVVLHVAVLSKLRVGGVHPDVMLLVAICGGLAAGPDRGAIVGFLAGLLADLFLPTPMGLSALAYCLVAFGVGSLQTGILRAAWWIPIVTAVGASAAGIVLYAFLGAMVGQGQLLEPRRLVLIAAVVAVDNALIAPAAIRFVSWSLRPSVAERAYAA